MATRPERTSELRSFLEGLSADPENYPAWEDADDLARLHIQDFAQRLAGGFNLLASRGEIRLAGLGIHRHALGMHDAGELLTRWQSLVTSTGAAIEGNKSVHNLPDELKRRTKLMLTASPGQGSLILEFAPDVDEAGERYPRGQTTLDGPPEALVQRSVNAAMDVVDLASRDNADLTTTLVDWGPRVASKALELAELAAGAQLDLDLTWEESGKGRRRSRSTARQFAQFAANLKAENLDTEPASLSGVLRTVSDRRKIDLEIENVESPTKRRVVSIARGNVDFSDFRIGESVVVAATVKLKTKPGGQEGRTYTAESVSPTGEAANK